MTTAGRRPSFEVDFSVEILVIIAVVIVIALVIVKVRVVINRVGKGERKSRWGGRRVAVSSQ